MTGQQRPAQKECTCSSNPWLHRRRFSKLQEIVNPPFEMPSIDQTGLRHCSSPAPHCSNSQPLPVGNTLSSPLKCTFLGGAIRSKGSLRSSHCAAFLPVPEHMVLSSSRPQHQTISKTPHLHGGLSGSLGLTKFGHITSHLLDFLVCGCNSGRANFFIVYNWNKTKQSITQLQTSSA